MSDAKVLTSEELTNESVVSAGGADIQTRWDASIRVQESHEVLRAELAKAKADCAAAGSDYVACLDSLDRTVAELNAARAELARVTKERDEARDDREMLSRHCESREEMIRDLAALRDMYQRELGEAKASLASLRFTFDDCKEKSETKGAAEERARIVTWVRKGACKSPCGCCNLERDVSAAIERGEHAKETTP